MTSLKVDSPAKINLVLRLLGKSGTYHRLLTLYHRISLKDTLILRKIPKGFRLTTDHRRLSCGEDNLITRAFRLLQKKFPGLDGVSVRLIKRTPLQGGLGGGSSNAAFFLLGMKRLFRLPLSLDTLCQMGKKLGADVSFFLYEVNQAIGTGFGEKITPLPARRKHWFVLVLNPAGLSTKLVYQTYDRMPKCRNPVSLTNLGGIVRIASQFLDSREPLTLARGLINDLEQPAIRLNPEIRRTLEQMVQLGAPAVAMSGSGPTVFAVYSSRGEAVNLAARLGKYIPPERIKVHGTF